MRILALIVLLLAGVDRAAAQNVQLPVTARTGRLGVRVVDTASLPVPGALVYLRSGSQQQRLDVLSHSAVGTGLAEIDGLPPDRYKLIVSLPGFHDVRQMVHVFPSDDQTVEVTLQPDPRACVVVTGHGPGVGQIRDQSGRVAPRMAVVTEAGAWPTIQRVSAGGSFGWCRPPQQFQEVAVVFEPVGRVVLKPAGTAATDDTWRVSLDIRGVQDAVRSSLMTRATTGAVDVAETPRRGRVVDEQGDGLPGVAVSFASLRGDPSDVAAVTSDQVGEYDLPQLPPGFYRVKATLPGFHGGVAYWDSADRPPVLEMAVSSIGHCISLTTVPDVRLTTRHGVPLAGAELVTVSPEGSQKRTLLHKGKDACFAPATADEVRVDIEGLGQLVLKPAGVGPAAMSWHITIDWTELVAKRLRRSGQ